MHVHTARLLRPRRVGNRQAFAVGPEVSGHADRRARWQVPAAPGPGNARRPAAVRFRLGRLQRALRAGRVQTEHGQRARSTPVPKVSVGRQTEVRRRSCAARRDLAVLGPGARVADRRRVRKDAKQNR